MLNWSRGAGPLAVDPLAALVDEDSGVTGARVERGQIGRDDREIGVIPGSIADPAPRVCRLIAVSRIALDADGPSLKRGSNGRAGERPRPESALQHP